MAMGMDIFMTTIVNTRFLGKTFFQTNYQARSSIVQLKEGLSVNLKKGSPISKNSDQNVMKICDIDIIPSETHKVVRNLALIV